MSCSSCLICRFLSTRTLTILDNRRVHRNGARTGTSSTTRQQQLQICLNTNNQILSTKTWPTICVKAIMILPRHGAIGKNVNEEEGGGAGQDLPLIQQTTHVRPRSPQVTEADFESKLNGGSELQSAAILRRTVIARIGPDSYRNRGDHHDDKQRLWEMRAVLTMIGDSGGPNSRSCVHNQPRSRNNKTAQSSQRRRCAAARECAAKLAIKKQRLCVRTQRSSSCVVLV